MPPQTQTRRILIKVDTGDSKALNDIASRMGLLNKNTKSLADNMGFLSNAFKGWLGFLGVREVTRMSDEMQNLFNRLKLVTGSLDGAVAAMAGLAGVADRTQQSLASVGDVYNRFAITLKDSGANTKELLSLTETLINSFRVSGSSADETRNAMIQLSQAFSIGVLRGQDLRSVLSQNAELASLLKQRYGADLFKKAEEGAISTAEVMKILATNQQKINQGAAQLAPTFEQTLTKALNKVTVSIGNLNEQYQLSAKFATIMGVATNNLTEIMTVMGAVFAVVAITRIPQMIEGLRALRVAMVAFAASNPLLLALTAIATVGALIYENWDKLGKYFQKAKLIFLDFAVGVEEAFFSMSTKIAGFLGTTLKPEAVIEHVQTLQSLKQSIIETKAALETPAQSSVKTDPLADMQKNLDSLATKLGKMPGPTKDLKEELALLNQEFMKNKNIDTYYVKLNKFDLHKATGQFKEGKTDVFKFHEELRDLEIRNINRDFTQGSISLKTYNEAITNSKLAVLNEQLKVGKISLSEYNKELLTLQDRVRPGSAFYTGVESFIESVGTLSQGISKVTSQAFDHLSDTLVDFVKTGKFQFADFTKAVIDDLTAIIIRTTIVRPLAQGILGLIGAGLAGGASGSFSGGTFNSSQPLSNGSYNLYPHAMGGVMTSSGPMPLNKYANGGVANSPQVALFGEGRRPEAYVPLPDGRNIPVKMDGGSGISVVQNITINSDGTSTSNSQEAGKNGKQMSDLIKRVTIDTIIQQKKPGGILA